MFNLRHKKTRHNSVQHILQSNNIGVKLIGKITNILDNIFEGM